MPSTEPVPADTAGTTAGRRTVTGTGPPAPMIAEAEASLFASFLDRSVQSRRYRFPAEATSTALPRADGLRRHRQVEDSLSEGGGVRPERSRRAGESDPGRERIERLRSRGRTAGNAEVSAERTDHVRRVEREHRGRTGGPRIDDAGDAHASAEEGSPAVDRQVTSRDREPEAAVDAPSKDSDHVLPAADEVAASAEGLIAVLARSGPVTLTTLPTAGEPGPSMIPLWPGGGTGATPPPVDVPPGFRPLGPPAGGGMPGAGTGLSGSGAEGPASATEPGSRSQPTLVFQQLLNQIGRPRTVPATLPQGLAAPADAGEGLKLTDARSLEELARVIRGSAPGRTSSVVLRLDPPDLGTIRLDIRMTQQQLQLRIEADTPAGLDLLTSRISDLRHSLERHGIRLDTVDVTLRSSPPQDHSPPREDAAMRHDSSGAWSQGGWTPQDQSARQQLGGTESSAGTETRNHPPWPDGTAGTGQTEVTLPAAGSSMRVDLIA